jgi:hypothetical protein|tara:strand:- start:98 stop:292 length:195 start_codon:yes stop_codon:yes gene_type:complete
METANFTYEVFAFIENTYGKNVLRKVKNKDNNTVVDNILADSLTKEYDVEKTSNKIIAMLRLNP